MSDDLGKTTPPENDDLSELGMLPLDKHSWALSQLLSTIAATIDGSSVGWPEITEWLDIAVGLEEVKLNRTKFDESVMWCHGAADYESARDSCLAPIIFQLTRFTYVWAALEAAIETMIPEGLAAREAQKLRLAGGGKIDDLCMYFRMRPPAVPAFYDRMQGQFTSLILSSRQYRSLFIHSREGNGTIIYDKRIKQLRLWITNPGLAIQDVYCIRNSFAHGALKFPLPDDWPKVQAHPPDAQILKVSTRLVLYALQMLISSRYRDRPSATVEIDDEDRPLDAILQRLGCSEVDEEDDQLQLSLFSSIP